MANQYFSQISNDYRADKNQLETSAKTFIKGMSNRIIPENSIEDFDNRLLEGIHAINLRFKKCKPLYFYKWKETLLDDEDIYRWSVDGVFMITLLPINEYPLPKI